MTKYLIEIQDLSGAALDWAVGVAWGIKDLNVGTFGPLFGKGYKWACSRMTKFHPSTDPEDYAAIIEKCFIGVTYLGPEAPKDKCWKSGDYYGPTAGVAICKHYVFYRLGYGPIAIPEELL